MIVMSVLKMWLWLKWTKDRNSSVNYYRKWKLISSEVGVTLKNRENSKFSKKIKLWSKFTGRTCVHASACGRLWKSVTILVLVQLKNWFQNVVINLSIVMMPQTTASVSCYIVKVNCRYLFLIFICCICLFFINFVLPHYAEIKLYIFSPENVTNHVSLSEHNKKRQNKINRNIRWNSTGL